MIVDVSVNRILTVALIDSSLSENFLSKDFMKRNCICLYRKSMFYLLTTANGSLIDYNQGMITEEAAIDLTI